MYTKTYNGLNSRIVFGELMRGENIRQEHIDSLFDASVRPVTYRKSGVYVVALDYPGPRVFTRILRSYAPEVSRSYMSIDPYRRCAVQASIYVASYENGTTKGVLDALRAVGPFEHVHTFAPEDTNGDAIVTYVLLGLGYDNV